MTKSQDEILVAFGIDERFACHLAVTITSIVKTAPGERFRFLVVHSGVGDASRQKVESCAPGQAFEWHEVTDARLLKLKGARYVSQATYYRLVLPQVAPAAAGRIIYLDSDVVVCHSLRDLWEADLKGRAVGAVFDAGLDPAAFARRYGLPERRLGYFNAGMLLLDLDRVRNEQLFAPVLEFLANCAQEPEFFDQDALNVAFWGSWTALSPMWNVQRKLLLRSSGPCYPEDRDLPADRRPRILHFTEQWKPWVPGSNHPYMWAYFRWALKTPFADEILRMSQAPQLKRWRWRVKYLMMQVHPALAYEPRRSPESWGASDAVDPLGRRVLPDKS